MNTYRLLTLLLFPLSTISLFSQSNFWTPVDDTNFRNSGVERWIVPNKYLTFELDYSSLKTEIANAPQRNGSSDAFTDLTLPMPDGTLKTFAIQEASIMADKLANKYPDIKSYSGYGLDDPSLAVYLDISPMGFHGMIIGPGQSYFIDPYFKEGTSTYVVYDKRNYSNPAANYFSCGYEPGGHALPSADMEPISNRNSAVSLRTYRIAIAATGEYTSYYGSSANAIAGINTTLNRVRGIYETDLAISFTLVANNNSLVYTDPATDPYGDSPTTAENQTNIDAVIGDANYDIGHLLDQGSNGGVAGLGVVCDSGKKSRGITGNTAPKGDPYDVDFIAHEIGHQFNAEHTFNGNLNSCGGNNRNASTAYEPNSGNTIMAYAGICGAQNIQLRSETHFHQSSLQEITDFVTNGTGATCPTVTVTSNNAPSVNANAEGVNGKYIPINTPFELTASGSDPDGHSLSYCWEQWDLTVTAGTSSTTTDGPVFRSFHPTNDATRTFPRLSSLLDNSVTLGEYLPSITRDLNFRCTVRDGQNSGGGTASDQITIHVTDAASNFAITSHNSATEVEGDITVTWNVGNTTASPVSCANVDILLSMDGGETFSALVTSTTNDGSEQVTLPNTATGQARLKVKCSDNVFFDINNADLRIAPSDATCAEQVSNGNFASYGSGWTQYSSRGQGIINGWGEGRSNAVSAWLGYLDNETAQVSQTVTIPSDVHFAELEFWYKLKRFDCGNDQFNIKVNGSIVQTISLCNNDAASGWKRALVDLSSYAGTSPTFMFEFIGNDAQPTDLIIDDVSIYTCVGGAFAVLPVEMIDFQVVKKGSGAMLNWATQSETNNRGFDIEAKGADGQFRKIGFQAGNGTTHELSQYQFGVSNLAAGMHYFRLKQIDMNGEFTYSPIRSLWISDGPQVKVFPNPSTDLVHFETFLNKESQLGLEVSNIAGQVIHQISEDRFAKGHFKWSMNVASLPAGVYFYRLVGDGFEEFGRFLVE